MRAVIHYDGQCPFCQHYVRHLRLRQTVASLHLVDLRKAPSELQRLEALGINVDAGMVLELDDQLYWGSEAAHRLALLSTRSDGFNHFNRWLFSSRWLANLFYPMLRIGRNLALLLLDRQPIQASHDAGTEARITLFSMAWGIFACLHVLVYATQFRIFMHVTSWAITPLGIALIFFPTSRRLFLLLTAVLLADAWLHLPMFSNHTLLKNVFLHALVLAGAWHAWRGQSWYRFFDDAAAVGRTALLCMYMFGIFHKINTDFLNPTVSCALALWERMPAWLNWIGGSAFELAAMYGTLVIEAAILICLLLPRSRHLGIVLGIGFHALLALSGYAMYVTFSTLTIALHLLFIDGQTAQRIVTSPLWHRWMQVLRRPTGVGLVLAWLALLTLLAWNGSYSSVGLAWLPAALALLFALIQPGWPPAAPTMPNLLWSRLGWLNLVSIAMFLTCFKPYLGLPTAQSMNMFANLRLEAGTSNHLVLRNAPGPFRYLEDVITLEQASPGSYLDHIHRAGMTVTWYDLLDKLERAPETWATFTRNGQRHERASAQTLAAEIEQTLHPRWLRNWWHFNPVDLRQPKQCAPNS